MTSEQKKLDFQTRITMWIVIVTEEVEKKKETRKVMIAMTMMTVIRKE